MLNLNYASDSGDDATCAPPDQKPASLESARSEKPSPENPSSEPASQSTQIKPKAAASTQSSQDVPPPTPKMKRGQPTVDSDDEAPEEASSSKPVRALEKKKKRRNNKPSKSSANALHPSKRQKTAGGGKENIDPDGAPEAVSSAATTAKEPAANFVPNNMCVVCKEANGKYKCPRCRSQICSVACSKAHKENHPADPPPKPKPAPSTVFIAPTQPSSDPSHPFSFLDNSAKLRALFERYPCLPDVLMKISEAKQPPKPTLGTPFVQSEAKRIEKKLWDQSVGEQHGKDALRRAREQHGEEGEAVRAYSELIIHLMEAQGRGGVSAVHKRKAREEGAMFQKLAQPGMSKRARL
ncbi:HIT zinc finger [Ceratocystis platani]|uniref:HIT zinc finger n=1 Tax=Ceratocystis fimbriata f. sp. platani TaxID=88771 RepID=A0A0F8AYN8_CERFI|nr:HIT zinc finger [Ceratocystis platani]